MALFETNLITEPAALSIPASTDPTAPVMESSLARQVGAAFELLRDQVFRYVYVGLRSRERAEDLAQDVFLRLFEYVSEGHSVDDVRLFLFRTAHNLVIDELRTTGREICVEAPEWDELLRNRRDHTLNPEQSAIQKERYQAIRNAVGWLTELERQVFLLRIQGLRYREIAEITGVTATTVSDAVYRGISKLKAELHA